MRSRRPAGLPLVGMSALLTIFAVLCLTTFALLSIATVQAEGRTAARARQAVEDYYAADTAAHRVLAQLREGQLPQGVERDGDTVRFICPISDTQQLEVLVELDRDEYQILQWQARPSRAWNNDETISVWDGEKEE